MPKLPTTPTSSEPAAQPTIQPITPFGSEEQRAIWKVLDEMNKHVVVQAVAGAGKTFCGVEYCKKNRSSRQKTAYVAFNRHIAVELAAKLKDCGNVKAMTYHSLGLQAINERYGRVEVDQYKVDGIIEKLIVEPNKTREAVLTARTRRLVSLAKQYGVVNRDELEKLCDYHLIDLNGMQEEVMDLVPKVLIEDKVDVRHVDFDDMIWMPGELRLSMPQYDLMLIDEAQDTSMSQQWLALNSADRLVVVGDKNQSVYSFRGADSEAMNRLQSALESTKRGCIAMPLTYTRRCPKSHVRLAQKIVPQIQALDDAIEGVVRVVGNEAALMEMKPGDMVLCRVNAELIGVAYRLIRRGVKAVVRGRDIAKGIEGLIEKAQKKAHSGQVGDVLKAAYEITLREKEKYSAIPNGRGEHRAASAQDRFECLSAISEEAKDVAEVQYRVRTLFAEFEDDGSPKNSVICSTVHRGKGMQARRVYILRGELMPHPMAKQPHERVGEMNVLYVAVTRSLEELVWVGGVSPVFEGMVR